MGKLTDLIRKLGGKEEEEDYVPREVIDRELDSLRRLRQVQLNEMEREQLKKQIAHFNRERTRKYLFGVKSNLEKRKELQERVNILKKKKSLLKENNLLKNRKIRLRKRKADILRNNSSFLGRGFL